MAIQADIARRLAQTFESPTILNLFAQSRARQILDEVGETPENYPAFERHLTEKVTYACYALLAVGCSLAEQNDRVGASPFLERAASLLAGEHRSGLTPDSRRHFHLLVAALAFYASGHYSQAFVVTRYLRHDNQTARAISAFLRKNHRELIEAVNEILLPQPTEAEDFYQHLENAMSLAIAKSLNLTNEFTLSGDRRHLQGAYELLGHAQYIAYEEGFPSWWWFIRLLRLSIQDLEGASPWTVLPPYFGPTSAGQLSRYIQNQAQLARPVTELWHSQLQTLPLALDQRRRGAVIGLRTSAGKTKVAELAILQALLGDPTSRALYLAPFRSLAIEVEDALSSSLGAIGLEVSFLYGGARISAADMTLFSESRVIIATPEKARALLRAEPELVETLRLVIVDEGHLIGPDRRLVRNEAFLEWLRIRVHGQGGRFLLLSAVLPNPQQVAEWITQDETSVGASDWKPSTERFGLVRWNGKRVRLDWLGEFRAFNPSFVVSRPLGYGRRRKGFPADKAEAVTATAVRLCASGPVLIFAGQARFIPRLAKSAITALGQDAPKHRWPAVQWAAFQAVCDEELDESDVVAKAASLGIICHSNSLPSQVRLAMERLMRSFPPRIIIATTTLGQGVNVGVSTVVIYSPYISQDTISHRDFWNICGRAGRAFVDGEGKILYAIDDSRKPYQIAADERLAQSYFRRDSPEAVTSGIWVQLNELRLLAARAGVEFEQLLELCAENDFSQLGEGATEAHRICDLLDDELLALHSDPHVNPLELQAAWWVQQVFQNSLAAIQARAGNIELDESGVFQILTARADYAVAASRTHRHRAGIVASALPLSIALQMQDDIVLFRGVAERLRASGYSLEAMTDSTEVFEEWSRTHASTILTPNPGPAALVGLRRLWLSGVGLRTIRSRVPEADVICRDYYGFVLPWIIQAAAQQLRRLAGEDFAEPLSSLSLLVELGLPSTQAARLFLAGVRSRSAATELSATGVILGERISEVRDSLSDRALQSFLRERVGPETSSWLDFFSVRAKQYEVVPTFPPFTIAGSENADTLLVRSFGGATYLVSPDASIRIAVAPTEVFPFDQIANDKRIHFRRAGASWVPVYLDPNLRPG